MFEERHPVTKKNLHMVSSTLYTAVDTDQSTFDENTN